MIQRYTLPVSLKEGAAPDRGEREMNVLFFLRCSGFSDVRNAV